MATGSSSSLKMRSDEAIAAWRTLNFSDMSLMGRKKRTRLEERDERAERQRARQHTQPPYQMISDAASAPRISIAG